jgi:DNA-directed RNA polymerase subunit M/transcription elongation factor TFIIS
MKKPTFYQAVLVEVNVLDHVYPQFKGKEQLTMTERMGSNEAKCSDCGDNKWMLLAKESVSVTQGGKPYCECLNCGFITHL